MSTYLHIISINNKNTPVAGLAACSSFHSDGFRLQMETAECQVQRLDVGATAWGRSQDVLRERYVNSHEGDVADGEQNGMGTLKCCGDIPKWLKNVEDIAKMTMAWKIWIVYNWHTFGIFMTAIRRSFLSWLKLGVVICHDETHKLNWLMWFAGPDVSRNDSGKSTTQRGGFQQSDAEESGCCHILDLDLWEQSALGHFTARLDCMAVLGGVPSEAHCQIWRGRHLRSHRSSVRGLNLFPGWASGCVKWFFPGFSKEWDPSWQSSWDSMIFVFHVFFWHHCHSWSLTRLVRQAEDLQSPKVAQLLDGLGPRIGSISVGKMALSHGMKQSDGP